MTRTIAPAFTYWIASMTEPNTAHAVRFYKEAHPYLDAETLVIRCDCKGYKYLQAQHLDAQCRHIKLALSLLQSPLKSFGTREHPWYDGSRPAKNAVGAAPSTSSEAPVASH